MATVHELAEAIECAERHDADRIIVDLAELSFIDSSAVHLLLHLRDRLTLRGGILLVGPGPAPVQRVLNICGLGETTAV
jgi:anti-anti-sigma factor